MKKNNTDETIKTFSDYQIKSWFQDENKNIKIGDTVTKIMAGECETLEVKEILHGEPYPTWRLVISKDDKFYLLKTSRELK